MTSPLRDVVVDGDVGLMCFKGKFNSLLSSQAKAWQQKLCHELTFIFRLFLLASVMYGIHLCLVTI